MTEDFDFWFLYVTNHKERFRDGTSRGAPYRDGLVWIEGYHRFVFFTKKGNGNYYEWHRLDGPAKILNIKYQNSLFPSNHLQYWINDNFYSKEEWEKHPCVVNTLINRLIVEVFSSD